MGSFKFLNNIYAVCYPPNYENKPDGIKYVFATGWNMYMEGNNINDCPFYETRHKNIWASGYAAAKNKVYGNEIF